MTPFILRKSLAEKLREITQDAKLANPFNEDLISPIVYEQNMPYKRVDDNPDTPHIIVRLSNTSIDKYDTKTVNIELEILCYDDSDENRAVDDAFNIASKIEAYLLANPFLNKINDHVYMFECEQSISIDIPVQNEQPQEFGYVTISLSFIVPKTNNLTGVDEEYV